MYNFTAELFLVERQIYLTNPIVIRLQLTPNGQAAGLKAISKLIFLIP